MSFGFSVGDFLAGAQLAHKLCQSLSYAKGASKEFQDLTRELFTTHRVLLQVEQLRACNQLTQSTLNAILFLAAGINEAMEEFMMGWDHYRDSLQRGGSGNRIKDIFRKGKWSISMDSEVDKLRNALRTNMLSLSVLVQLACYFNTGYDPQTSASLDTSRPGEAFTSEFPEIKTDATITGPMTVYSSATFHRVPKPSKFFRPGQVFSTVILAKLDLESRVYRGRDWQRLPLLSSTELRERQKIRDSNREVKLAQLLKLPLDEMFQYGTCLPNGKVMCGLCSQEVWKEEWLGRHFPERHNETFQKLSTPATIPNRSKWTTLDDVDSDRPILSDTRIESYKRGFFMQLPASYDVDPWLGAILIRRFVVVRQGKRSCLCLGIHTNAGKGCGDQPDQELFAIFHSSKEIPPPLTGETGMRLQPIRMKAEHPSTALPSSARICFGRVYEVFHDVNLKSLGLIHDVSMENLQLQFSSHCPKASENDNQEEAVTDFTVSPADINVVKDIREDINTVFRPEDGI
ncbi:hypothetical protein BDV38DRAFT_292185 [Aspergillus pseudotamarii]|uniref:DUF6590 domain-containing protein n=1 Tax=Aspergillus pseudotamarii TaxID=132259 RepID=A0A5N6SV81_ASPPS|nr:uncharacterized protein BDV38DRAFT_292185 [Aspergillus pseudotamarii]KAE8138588.1 hypothetical protein BDV38DRAFT_292185 [Aspergillus pseudotamarii]